MSIIEKAIEKLEKQAQDAVAREAAAKPAPPPQVAAARVRPVAQIPLAELSSRGFVTPDQPRSQIAEEYRMIKRPLLANIDGETAAQSGTIADNLVLKAARAMDVLGNREARVWVSMVKAMVPERVCQIIDEAMQIHGATGISQWTPLAEMYAHQRHLRFADGPDEVHHMVVGRAELQRH